MNTITETEFNRLYLRYRRPLIAYVSRRMRDDHRSADVVQECFMTLYQQDYSRVIGHERQWLFTVCRNGLIKKISKESKYLPTDMAENEESEPIDENCVSPLDILCEEETAETKASALLKAVKKLPQRIKEMLRLRYIEGMKYREIAEKMGLSLSNVGYLLYTAHDDLSALLPSKLKEIHNARKSKNRHSPRAKRRAKATGNILASK